MNDPNPKKIQNKNFTKGDDHQLNALAISLVLMNVCAGSVNAPLHSSLPPPASLSFG